MTPAELAKSGSEHAHQRALFARIAEYRNEYIAASKKDKERNGVLADILPSPFVCEKAYVLEHLKLLFAINNAVGRNSAIHGARNKAEGVKAGVWDLFLPVPSFIKASTFGGWSIGSYHGLFIEMKEPGKRNHKNGGLSDEQVMFGNNVRANDYATKVCYTWEEAFNTLLFYLNVQP